MTIYAVQRCFVKYTFAINVLSFLYTSTLLIFMTHLVCHCRANEISKRSFIRRAQYVMYIYGTFNGGRSNTFFSQRAI